MKAKGKENCTNCAYHHEFKYFDNDTMMQMRCWEHPDEVYDHAFVQSMKKAEKYVCGAYKSYEAKAAEDYEEAKMDYISAKKRIAELEEKYPDFKDLTIK